MNVKQLVDRLEPGNKRIDIITPNPYEEHWIKKVEFINNQCVIFSEYWEDEDDEQIDVNGLLHILSQMEQSAEIKIQIPTEEQLCIKDVKNAYVVFFIYVDYEYEY